MIYFNSLVASTPSIRLSSALALLASSASGTGLPVRIRTASLSNTVSTGAETVRLQRGSGRHEVADERGDPQPGRELDRAVHLHDRRRRRRCGPGSAGRAGDKWSRCAAPRAKPVPNKSTDSGAASFSVHRPKPSGATTSTRGSASPSANSSKHVVADDPELADSVADEGWDIVVADEHQIRREILHPGGQRVAPALDPKPRIPEQAEAEVGKPAGFLDRDVEAGLVNEHRTLPASRSPADSRRCAHRAETVRPGRRWSC